MKMPQSCLRGFSWLPVLALVSLVSISLTVPAGAQDAVVAIDQEEQFTADRQEPVVYAVQTPDFAIGHTLSASSMIRAGDFNLARGIARMPGVHVGRFGEINLRGAGRGRYGVQMNGLPVASTDVGGRSTDLGIFSSDLFSDLTIAGVQTPDVDATGIGGVVHLNAWRPIGAREIGADAGGMALSDYSILNGLGRVASVHYSERFDDRFSMAARFSHQLEVFGYESLGIVHDARDFGNGFVDVIERVSPGLHAQNRSRTSGLLQFGYQPATNTRYYLIGLYGVDHNEMEAHLNTSIANGDWLDQTTTGNLGQRGVFRYNPQLNRSNVNFGVVQAGGVHRVNRAVIAYSLGWSGSTKNRNAYDFRFGRDRLNYSVDLSNSSRPAMIITNIPLMSDGTVDQTTMFFDDVVRVRNQQFENRYAARVDLTAPVGAFRFKAGSSVLFTQSERKFEDATLSTLRRYDQSRFQKIPRSSVDVLNRYFYPDLIDSRLTARYVDVSRPDMRLNQDDMFRRSSPGNYSMDEAVFSGYALGSATFGSVSLAAGVRAEMTRADYTGRSVLFNQFRIFSSSSDTTASTDYTDLFPYAAASFAITDKSMIRLAYSKSIERPAHDVLAPFEMIIPADTIRFMGNAGLKPVLSDNLELGVEHSIGNSGAVSVGIYYRQFTNFVYFREQRVQESEFPFLVTPASGTLTVNERSYVNSDQAVDLYGVIVGLYQQFDFLPAPFSDLSVLANYSYAYSDSRDMREAGDVYLRHLSPHVVNASLAYNKNRFMVQLAWHWSAPSLDRRSGTRQWAPGINRTEQIFVDRYEDGWSDLSAHVVFRLSDSFRFWANVHNLLPNERNVYSDSDAAYVFHVSRMSGVMASAGIRFSY